MAKVTSKLQVTVPKSLADKYGIRPGDEIEWLPAGDSIRVVPAKRPPEQREVEFRLKLFDQATQRQVHRQEGISITAVPGDRGWTREELYERGGSR